MICDETTDESTSEQLCITIRSVDNNYNVFEDVIGLYEISRQDTPTIIEAILDTLTRCGLDIANCRGQSYDGASNMYVGYPGSGFAYFPLGFAHKGDQKRDKRDQDRTRRALSNALFTFPLTLPQIPGKPEILSKNNEKNATYLVNPATIRPKRGRKSQTYLDR